MGQERLRPHLLPAILLCAALLSGCSQTHRVSLDPLDPAVQQRISKTSQRKDAQLQLTNQQRALVRGVVVEPDSTTWHIRRIGYRDFYSVPTERVHSIRFKHRRSGAAKGLAIGALVGAMTSFALLLQPDPHRQAPGGLIRIMPFTGAAGLVLGLVRGDRERYVFEEPLSIPVTPARPTMPVVASVPAPGTATTNTADPPPPANTINTADTPNATNAPSPAPSVAQEAQKPKNIEHVVKDAVQALDTLLAETVPPPQEAAAQQATGVSQPAVASQPTATPQETAPPGIVHAPAVEPSPSPSSQRSFASPGFSGWTLVVGSFTSTPEVEAALQQYQARIPTTVPVNVVPSRVDGIVRYRVTIGRYDTQAEARMAQKRLAGSLPADAWPLRVRPGL